MGKKNPADSRVFAMLGWRTLGLLFHEDGKAWRTVSQRTALRLLPNLSEIDGEYFLVPPGLAVSAYVDKACRTFPMS